jgi:hypothetical protein
MGGHSGILVTLRRLKQVFAWKGMAQSVHDFVSKCFTCQQAKPDRAKYYSPWQCQQLHGKLYLWILLKAYLALEGITASWWL